MTQAGRCIAAEGSCPVCPAGKIYLYDTGSSPPLNETIMVRGASILMQCCTHRIVDVVLQRGQAHRT